MANITQNFTVNPGDTLTLNITGGQPAPINPPTTASFTDAIRGMAVAHDWRFGTASDRNVHSIADLAKDWDPYGVAGTTPINDEWERYQPFNSQNHAFNATNLALTATIPTGGGLRNGGINSGGIYSRAVFQPNVTGAQVYAIEFLSQFPGTIGMWPAWWLYRKDPNAPNADDSEIDVEFFMMQQNQNQFDWTGFNHGPSIGEPPVKDVYSIMTNQWVWHPGTDFSAAFHRYQYYWTPDMIYKYVDGLLIKQTAFKWTSGGQPQICIDLACGSDSVGVGMKPTNLNQFPAKLLIDHVTVWAK